MSLINILYGTYLCPGKKPQKPQRPLLPKTAERKLASETKVNIKQKHCLRSPRAILTLNVTQNLKRQIPHTRALNLTLFTGIFPQLVLSLLPPLKLPCQTQKTANPFHVPVQICTSLQKKSSSKFRLVKLDENCEKHHFSSQEVSTNGLLKESWRSSAIVTSVREALTLLSNLSRILNTKMQ